MERGTEDHASLEFAHDKELEDLQRYPPAWLALQRGNAVLHARLPTDAARESALFDRLIDMATADLLRTASAPIGDGRSRFS